MKRRAFISILAALPFMAKAAKVEIAEKEPFTELTDWTYKYKDSERVTATEIREAWESEINDNNSRCALINQVYVDSFTKELQRLHDKVSLLK